MQCIERAYERGQVKNIAPDESKAIDAHRGQLIIEKRQRNLRSNFEEQQVIQAEDREQQRNNRLQASTGDS